MIKHLTQEIKRAIPGIVYFWLAFSLIYYTSGLMLPPDTERHFTYFAICLGAIFVGKVIFLTNMFSFINLFPQKPLIYNITWKFFIYTIMIFVFWMVDNFLRTLYLDRNIEITCMILKNDLISPVFWSSVLWLMATFLIYTIFAEFMRAIGKLQIKSLLFGP